MHISAVVTWKENVLDTHTEKHAHYHLHTLTCSCMHTLRFTHTHILFIYIHKNLRMFNKSYSGIKYLKKRKKEIAANFFILQRPNKR